MNCLNQKRKLKLSDIELIAVDLTSEYMSIGSVYQLFRILPSELPFKIERSIYNRRKRKLFDYRKSLRRELASQISDNTGCIVNSMSLEVCNSLTYSTAVLNEVLFFIKNKNETGMQLSYRIKD